MEVLEASAWKLQPEAPFTVKRYVVLYQFWVVFQGLRLIIYSLAWFAVVCGGLRYVFSFFSCLRCFAVRFLRFF